MIAPAVLLLDPDEDSRQICGAVLRHHGYRVLSATTAEEGVEMARVERPAVVVLEVALPGRDGWSVVADLRADARTADVPVVVMTGRVTEAERERSKELGCAVWLPKPCSPSHLLAEVQRLLRTPIEMDTLAS